MSGMVVERKRMTEVIDTKETQPLATSDEETMELFLSLLNERVSIATGFVPDEETGLLTHQVLQIQCGNLTVTGAPEELAFPLTPAAARDIGVTIN